MDEMTGNQASNEEKAEGLREKVDLGEQSGGVDDANGADNPMERGSGQLSEPGKPQGTPQKDRGNAGGITNRPLSEEQREEDQLAPRGGRKPGGHAA